MRRGLAGLAAALLLAWAAGAAAQPRDDGGGAAAEGFRVPRAVLSTQAEAPYRFGGHVVDEEFAQWRRYRRALRRYPDTPSCLREEARGEPAPDLLAAFDWRGLRTEADLEVCLFRVFASLGSIGRAGDWMAAAGLDVGPIREGDGIPDAYTRIVQGFLSWEEARQVPALRGNLFGWLLNAKTETSFMFSVRALDDSVVNSVDITPSRK